MKFLPIIILFIAIACGGSLSREQRKQIREKMEAGAIKKISEAELTEAAYAYSRNIVDIINNSSNQSRPFLDSLEKVYKVEIIFMHPNEPGLRGIERKIMEAYASNVGSVDPGDNLQKMGNDSLIYTKALMKERPDGSLAFTQALGVRMTKKAIVLSIKE